MPARGLAVGSLRDLVAFVDKSFRYNTSERVLIIDDEQGILSLTRDVLLEEQFEVETASDGETGLKKARAGESDVILCDWRRNDHLGSIWILVGIRRGSRRLDRKS